MDLYNNTDFQAEIIPLGLPGGDLYDILTIKVSYRVEKGRLVPDPEPFPIFQDEEEIDGRKFASDWTLDKEGCDVAILGDAVAPGQASTTLMNVKVLLGKKSWTFVIFGDRHWEQGLTGYRITRPESFFRMPLDWCNAYGGKMKDEKGQEHAFWHNPDGKGYVPPIDEPPIEGLPLPNIEAPDRLIKEWKQQPIPAGCAFYPTSWGLRMQAGVEKSDEGRPQIKRALFNQAHPDFVLEDFPLGEELLITGMTEAPSFRCILEAPELTARIEGRQIIRPLEVRWDTLCIVPEAARLYIVGRAGFYYDDDVLWDHVAVVAPKR